MAQILRGLPRFMTSILAAVVWIALLVIPAVAQINIITTAAGDGTSSISGNGFPANSAGVPNPRDVAVDANGTLYILSAGVIRRVNSAGIIDTFATIPQPATGVIGLGNLTSVSGLAHILGNIYVIQGSSMGLSRVLRFLADGTSSVFVPPGTLGFNFFGGGSAGMAFDNKTSYVYIVDRARHRVIGRALGTAAVTVVAGRTDVNGFSGDGGAAIAASLNEPCGIAVDDSGNLYIADSGNHRVRRVDKAGTITTVAGSGGPAGGFGGDGGLAVSARLNSPRGLAVDSQNNLYIADTSNRRVRRIDLQGIITTVAGSGVTSACFTSACFSGDNGHAVSAQLSFIDGLAVDGSGNLYIADSSNNRVRKVTFNAPPSQLPPPTIQSNGGIGVVNGAGFQREIASGSWVTIFGQNLAPILAPGRTWRDSEIVEGKLPISLEGVSVRFNGKYGYIYFVGPRQLNVLAPDDLPFGLITIEVETPSGNAQTSADVRPVAPGLFRTVAGPIGTIYTAAVHSDGMIVGHPSSIPGSRPARAGNTISIYGSGFGPTSPPRPAGELFSPAALSAPYGVSIDGNRVSSTFGGIVGPGLYQFNISMPAVRGPFAFVRIELGGQSTDDRMVLAVE